MQVYGPRRTAYTDVVTRTGNAWSYTPFLSDGLGSYSVWIHAIDASGNARVSSPFVLTPRSMYLPLIMRQFWIEMRM